MADMFTVTIKGDQEIIAQFVSMPAKLRQALVAKTYELEALLEAKLKIEHLSGPTGANTLSRRSGDLFRSVHGLTVVVSDVSVRGGVGYGADVPYAAAHEFGAVINIPEIVPIKAQALHFIASNGKEVFAKRVAAHQVHIPERAPLRTSFNEMQQTIIDGYSDAAKGALHK